MLKIGYSKYHVIQSGENLQLIATQKLGDVNRWQELARLNGLHYPYIVSDSVDKMENPEHLLMFGDRLELPVRNSVNDLSSDTINKKTYDEVYDMSLGMDLGLTFSPMDGLRDHIMGLTPRQDGKGTEVVKGVDNLRQSLALRLLTNQGTLPYHPNYGSRLNNFIGIPITKELAQDIKNELIRTCKTDPRVREVKVDDFIEQGDSFWCEILITPLSSKEAFSLFVDTAQSQVNIS